MVSAIAAREGLRVLGFALISQDCIRIAVSETKPEMIGHGKRLPWC